MRSYVDGDGKVKMIFNPDFYRDISYERIKSIMKNRGSHSWPQPDPARNHERKHSLSLAENMSLIGLTQLICEYEAGELNRHEILQLFAALIRSQLITFLPFELQYIAFQLVLHQELDANGGVQIQPQTDHDATKVSKSPRS